MRVCTTSELTCSTNSSNPPGDNLAKTRAISLPNISLKLSLFLRESVPFNFTRTSLFLVLGCTVCHSSTSSSISVSMSIGVFDTSMCRTSCILSRVGRTLSPSFGGGSGGAGRGGTTGGFVGSSVSDTSSLSASTISSLGGASRVGGRPSPALGLEVAQPSVLCHSPWAAHHRQVSVVSGQAGLAGPHFSLCPYPNLSKAQERQLLVHRTESTSYALANNVALDSSSTSTAQAHFHGTHPAFERVDTPCNQG